MTGEKELREFVEKIGRMVPVQPAEKKWLDNQILILDTARQARLLLSGSLDDPGLDPAERAKIEKRHEGRLANLAKAKASRESRARLNADGPDGPKAP